MTLSNKIFLLIAFIALSSIIVVYWFTQRLFQHMEGFRHSMATQRQFLEEQQAAGIRELHHKREKLKQDVATHLNHMEAGLAKNQEYADEFDKEFLEGQNAVFDAIEAFHEGKPVK